MRTRCARWLALALLLALVPAAAPAVERTAHLFISDLHMNLDQPYAWLDSHVATVAQFLEEAAARPDLAELTILGDFLDDWVMPHEVTPADTFESILTTPRNQPVVTALQALCADPAITVNYLTGNHDLLSFEEANQAVVAKYFPGINIVSQSPGVGRYGLDGAVYGEHGNRYTICNSPDVWSWSPQDSQLPLGYFITRTVTKDGGGAAYPDVLAQYLKKGLGLGGSTAYEAAGDSSDYSTRSLGVAASGAVEDVLKWLLDQLIKDFPGFVNDVTGWLYDALVLFEGMSTSDAYVMDGLDNFATDPLVSLVDSRYRDLITSWSARQDVVDPATAIIGDMGYLDQAAQYLLGNPQTLPFAPEIILFGHTHIPYFQQYTNGTLYVNTGTWIDSKACTYVEIDTGSDSGGYDVELWQYAGKDGVRDPKQLNQAVITAQ